MRTTIPPRWSVAWKLLAVALVPGALMACANSSGTPHEVHHGDARPPAGDGGKPGTPDAGPKAEPGMGADAGGPDVERADACIPEPDVCNDRDDDCDGHPDPGCPTEVVLRSPTVSPKWGGGGGSLQEASCPERHVLVGVKLKAGLCCFPRRPVVKALQGLCAPLELAASGEPYTYDVPVATSEHASMDVEVDVEEFHETLLCPDGQAVTGVDTGHGWYLDSIALRCGELEVAGEQGSYRIETRPTMQTDAPFGKPPHEPYDCPDGGVVAGLNLWTGALVDALQLVCTAPTAQLRPIR